MSATTQMAPPVITDILEVRAAEQRRKLHNSVEELRVQMHAKLDVRKNAQEYVWPASGVAGLLGLVIGYGFASLFT